MRVIEKKIAETKIGVDVSFTHLRFQRRRRPAGEKLFGSECGTYRVRRRSIVMGVTVPSAPWYPLVLVDLPDGRQMWDFVDRVRHRSCGAAMTACERHARQHAKGITA
jgi:hypothetical protein